MLTSEDVESWNKLFPECQINKINLTNPNEHFLTNALVGYLRSFGYNIEPPFNLNAECIENNKETRIFLIKLARQIDHFLKITDKSYTFTYYDLIRPTPKKTAHMLYILLNYYYYYNLYKEEVFKVANDSIRKLDDLRCLIDDTRRDNEQRKEENKNTKSKIENLREEIPLTRLKLKELENKLSQKKEEFKKLNNSYQDLKTKLKHLEEQKKLMNKRSVPEEEFQELKNQLQQLEIHLAEHKEMELTNLTNLNECKKSNLKLQILSTNIKEAYEIVPLRLVKLVREINIKLAKVQKEEQNLNIRKDSILQEIEEQNLTKFSLDEEQKSKEQFFVKQKKSFTQTLNSMQITLKQKDIEIQLLQEKDHISECELEEQKDIQQYLFDNLAEILPAHKI